MTDFLLELLSEEIPARMQPRARNDLARLFAEALDSAGLTHGAIETFSTPRRLALIAREVAGQTEAASEELKGPRTSAPSQALEGFLRKTGLTQDQLEDRDGTWFARIDRPGRSASQVIAEAVAAIITDFPWPKSMRWGSGELRWVRPLHAIVALLGEEIVPVEIGGIASGATTLGHRFHHPGPITIGGAHDYAEKLRACHVIVDQDEREAIIRDGAAAAAREAGLELIADEGLVVENAGLTEWPVPLLGRFDPDFLDVPREVIVLTMRTNQKYFACAGEDGALAPAFVCTANIDASDGGAAIVEGNRRVLAARLADARFFWEQDLKVPLETYVPRLQEMVFHEKLGTMLDRCSRIAGIAQYFAHQFEVSHEVGHRAGYLCKADLVTSMVGEFPELQGLIGGYYAERSEAPGIALAIRDHYRPEGPSDRVPEDRLTVAVSLADKLDALVGFFAIGEQPTGSKDPFALRRAALGVIALIVQNGIRMNFMHLAILQVAMLHVNSLFERLTERNPTLVPIWTAFREENRDKIDYDKFLRKFDETLKECGYPGNFEVSSGLSDAIEQLRSWSKRLPDGMIALGRFVVERLKIQQRDAGVRHDLIEAVFALGEEDDILRLLARVARLQDFIETTDGNDLLAAYKRAANILKKEKGSWTPDQAGGDDIPSEEQALMKALDAAEPKAAKAIEDEDFTAAMAALASLRAPIDAFFDKVTVNAEDPGTRARRLALLARFRDAVNRVADFSKIEG